MKLILRLINIGLGLIFYLSVSAQDVITVGYNFGNVLPHTKKLDHLSDIPTKGFNINLGLNPKELKDWNKSYNYPNYGLSYNYKTYDDEHLGDAHSLSGYLQFSFLPKRWFVETGIIGYSGVGYAFNKYNYEDESTYVALSTKLNIFAQARIYLKLKANPFFVEYSYGLDHLSNGLVRAPNLGLNVISHSVSMGINKGKKNNSEITSELIKGKIIKNEIWTSYSFGVKEIDFIPGKYVFHSATLNYSKQITTINKIGFGFDYANDGAATDYAIKTYNFHGRTNLNERFGLNIQAELLFGNFSFFTAYGFYFGDDAYYPSKKYYKVGFKQNFNRITSFIIIRAIPLFRADIFEFGVGYRLFWYKNED